MARKTNHFMNQLKAINSNSIQSRMLGSIDDISEEDDEVVEVEEPEKHDDKSILKDSTTPIEDKMNVVTSVDAQNAPEETEVVQVEELANDVIEAPTPLISSSPEPPKKTVRKDKSQVEKKPVKKTEPEVENEPSEATAAPGIIVAEDILAMPKIQGETKRINYSIRVEMVEVIKVLSKQSRMSSNIIVERVFEKYLVKDGLQALIPTLPDRYREVKLEKNGLNDSKKDFLQITIPIYYVDKIAETTKNLNESYLLDMTKGHLVDILLSDAIKIGDAYHSL